MLPPTGQTTCYDAQGNQISCLNSGQDGEFSRGNQYPQPRFEVVGDTVHDQLTGLSWSRAANPGGFPLPWQEALDAIRNLNLENFLGFNDWRLPNRGELRSLMGYQAKKPALPAGHPFINVFLGWYWSSTTAAINPAYAWSVHLEGARMFYGRKQDNYLFWPVRGEGNDLLRQTGQTVCYDRLGEVIPCDGSGHDGELRLGRSWPQPRFDFDEHTALDRLTGLRWLRHIEQIPAILSWSEALETVAKLNKQRLAGIDRWRLPNINELESLVDSSRHTPALPDSHPFTGLQDGYWSSTTSYFETDWAWVLYLNKGACGVGFKPGRTFFTWPVT